MRPQWLETVSQHPEHHHRIAPADSGEKNRQGAARTEDACPFVKGVCKIKRNAAKGSFRYYEACKLGLSSGSIRLGHNF